MSARDVIARAISEDLTNGWGEEYDETADACLKALTAAGYPIVHKDEIHAPSVERAIAVAVETYGSAKDWDYFGSAHVAIAAALRELMKEVG